MVFIPTFLYVTELWIPMSERIAFKSLKNGNPFTPILFDMDRETVLEVLPFLSTLGVEPSAPNSAAINSIFTDSLPLNTNSGTLNSCSTFLPRTIPKSIRYLVALLLADTEYLIWSIFTRAFSLRLFLTKYSKTLAFRFGHSLRISSETKSMSSLLEEYQYESNLVEVIVPSPRLYPISLARTSSFELLLYGVL